MADPYGMDKVRFDDLPMKLKIWSLLEAMPTSWPRLEKVCNNIMFTIIHTINNNNNQNFVEI
jgi:hypothetical protein